MDELKENIGISSSCSEIFWGGAVVTAVYTINRIHSHVIGNISPYECPDYHMLKVFGSACFVLLQSHQDQPSVAPKQTPSATVESVTSTHVPSTTTSLPLRRTTRVSQPSVLLRDYVCSATIPSTPRTYREASSNPLWQQAMVEELTALTTQHTWDVVDMPSNKPVVGCKWVYKIKTQADDSID
ncbi:UNVERIFIED_CONTAM: hypothetical protein Scaly_0270200 [Sesamum calycinum]|uniref:Mitochondrial protein n=1 Tax=Sesamum calycinum TaxID=2727403 RepID=A0AAW2SBP4_9LAMI